MLKNIVPIMLTYDSNPIFIHLLRKHLAVLRSNNPRADDHQIQRIHFGSFHTWFTEHVC